MHGRGELGAQGQAIDICVGHGRWFDVESKIVTRVEEMKAVGLGLGSNVGSLVGDLMWKTELFELRGRT